MSEKADKLKAETEKARKKSAEDRVIDKLMVTAGAEVVKDSLTMRVAMGEVKAEGGVVFDLGMEIANRAIIISVPQELRHEGSSIESIHIPTAPLIRDAINQYLTKAEQDGRYTPPAKEPEEEES